MFGGDNLPPPSPATVPKGAHTRMQACQLESPTWQQQREPCSKVPGTNWIQTSLAHIWLTKKTLTKSSPPSQPWTPVLLMTLLFAMASGTKIVFEEIGHMAGALSYQHVVISVNLTSLPTSQQLERSHQIL